MLRLALSLSLVMAIASLAAEPSWSKPVRVMSFNIRYGTAKDGENAWDKRKDFVASTIASYDPDLLGTQETLAFQRDFLSEKMTGYGVFGAGRDDGKDAGEMAALFYKKARFEKLDGGHFWLSDMPDKAGSKGWDAALPRVATWVKLKDLASLSGLPVLFVNTHFDHRGVKARKESASLTRTKVDELGKGCRVIVTGDFNADEGSDPYKALFGESESKPSLVVDSFRAMHPTRGKEEGTFSGFKAGTNSGARIDWIACSRDWEVRLAGIDRTTLDGRTPSDHFPVTAVLRPVVKGEPPTLRILSYNIHHGEGTDGKLDLPRIARIIRDADPDLVALQELDERTTRTGNIPQTLELARLTGMYGAFGKAIDFGGGGYGQAILSRFPLIETKVHALPAVPKQEQRIAYEAKVNIGGQGMTFLTTHLDHQLPELREKQAAKLNELFASAEHPTILAGDLNATPESKVLSVLKAKWSASNSEGTLLTSPADKPTHQIDYILFRPSTFFRVTQAQVIEEPHASDHRPVLAVLQLSTK